MAFPLANPLPASDEQERVRHLQSRSMSLLRYWHLASLDAPTVAVTWALAFAWTTRVHLQSWIVLLLACGTWTVYVADRLLDAGRAIQGNELFSLRERHHFHWRHRRLLIPLALCGAITACTLILRRMPVVARERDSVLAAAALAYFSGVHTATRFPTWLQRAISKEFLVGLIFTAGCAVPAFTRSQAREWPLYACFTFFALLAWMNCCAIERWESSAVETNIFARAGSLGLIGFAGSIVLVPTNPRIGAFLGAGAASAVLLAVLDRSRARTTPLALRTLADLVLLTPISLLILGAHIG